MEKEINTKETNMTSMNMAAVKMEKVETRGRKPTYKGRIEQAIVSVLRLTAKVTHNGANAKSAMDILRAPAFSPLRALRSKVIPPNGVNISKPTLYKIAKRNGIAITDAGRPSVDVIKVLLEAVAA